MKRLIVWLLVVIMALGCLNFAAADLTVIEPDMELDISGQVQDIEKTHPMQESIAPLTGLPASGEPYTPIALILDNSPEVYPHWGVSEADWIVQVPLRKDGGTRLMAIYGNEYPEQAGGARSSRMTNLPVAVMFHADFAYAGHAPIWGENIEVDKWIDEWDYNKPIRYVDLLGNRFRERVDFLEKPLNLSAHIKEIHESLIERKVKFENRGPLFTDEPLTAGDEARVVHLQFMSLNPEEPVENTVSDCDLVYSENKGYVRASKSGIFSDRFTGEEVTFANVIIMRTGVEWDGNYPYYTNHLKVCGQAEIFQNGRHFTGAWYRAGRLTRLVVLDENGEEIAFQRGRTYLAIGEEHMIVSYE
ncbi:MAG: DUF3048 domain-containing protein [Clostridia bacterium]|nr:DUF3048 domain-containing protein [Clostridia bacterium]